MTIRPATPRDAAVIADYNIRLAWETERLALPPATIQAGVAALLEDHTKGRYFVAETDAEPGQTAADFKVLGQLMITYEWSDWRNGMIWWIQSVYVRESARGQGIFKALFRHVEDLARTETGVCALRLYMEQDNATARRAYEKLGMHQTHYQVFEYDLRG